ncbi:hypothetical protein [Methylomagnum sp.]
MPVFWSLLDKAGNSDTAERIALMERFLKVFGATRIAALLCWPTGSSSARTGSAGCNGSASRSTSASSATPWCPTVGTG